MCQKHDISDKKNYVSDKSKKYQTNKIEIPYFILMKFEN